MADKKIEFWDKFLPNQAEYSHQYVGGDYYFDLYKSIIHASGLGSANNALNLEQTELFTVEEMGSNPISLRFLEFILRVSGAKRVLEIGSFIGASAMAFARALPADGRVVTIEKFDHFAAIARRNIESNGLSEKITLLEGDAFEVIASLPKNEMFDFIFIDGNKERYKEYMEATIPLLKPEGIVAVDDCFFHGDALNATPTNEKGKGCKAALDYSAGLDGWTRIAMPISNGILLLRRENL